MARRAGVLALALLAAPAGAGSACLTVETQSGRVATVPAGAGREVRLGFRHSIYGSRVEEHFCLVGDVFELVRLRYAERRLAEFYGHEAARREAGWWVIDGPRRRVPALDLRVSPESRIQVSVGAEPIPLWDVVEPGGWVRLAAARCEGRHDAR